MKLKQYGQTVRLEEKVAEIVEAAEMADDCDFMSFDHGMMQKMKELRPGLRTGVLAPKALGDLTRLGADFVAVEKKTATGRSSSTTLTVGSRGRSPATRSAGRPFPASLSTRSRPPLRRAEPTLRRGS